MVEGRVYCVCVHMYVNVRGHVHTYACVPIKFRYFLRTIVLWQTTFYCNLYVFSRFQFPYFHIKHCFSKVLIHVIVGNQLLHKGVDPFLSVSNRQMTTKMLN